MQTEWHNYKSAKTKQVAGSYGYLPEKSDDVLFHAYRIPSGLYMLHSYVHWGRVDGAFASLGAAKLHAARAAAVHFADAKATLGPLQGQLL